MTSRFALEGSVHLRKVVGKAKLHFEDFSTLFIQVDACLHSHLMTPIPKASNALEVLTPGHFLMGNLITALLDESNHEVVDIHVPLR